MNNDLSRQVKITNQLAERNDWDRNQTVKFAVAFANFLSAAQTNHLAGYVADQIFEAAGAAMVDIYDLPSEVEELVRKLQPDD